MSDPIEAANDWLEAVLSAPPYNIVVDLTVGLAIYERAKVVCDHCGGENNEYEDSMSALGIPGGWVPVGPCLNPGPMLQGADGPFHADAKKVQGWCKVHNSSLHVTQAGIPVCHLAEAQRSRGIRVAAFCDVGYVARDQTVWKEGR